MFLFTEKQVVTYTRTFCDTPIATRSILRNGKRTTRPYKWASLQVAEGYPMPSLLLRISK